MCINTYVICKLYTYALIHMYTILECSDKKNVLIDLLID
jgi:hypothetical protein